LDDNNDDEETIGEVGGVQNNSQFSNLTMDPHDLPNPPSSFQTPTRHSLVRTKQKEAYVYSFSNVVGVVKRRVVDRMMRRKCTVCKTKKTSLYCEPCFKSSNCQTWICTGGVSNCFNEHCGVMMGFDGPQFCNFFGVVLLTLK